MEGRIGWVGDEADENLNSEFWPKTVMKQLKQLYSVGSLTDTP